MALQAYIQLKADGSDIYGETTVESIGGVDVVNSIEAVAFFHELTQSTTDGARRASGHMQAGPITFVKAQDKSSPLLMYAMTQNHGIEGTVKLFSQNPDYGSTQHYHTFYFNNGRIISFRTEMLNGLFPENGSVPVLERVSISYGLLRSTNEIHSTETEFNWQQAV